MGGTGKSSLAWEWTTQYAPDTRKDWAGIFWYSFYEKGAVMADFCRRALAYITQQPLEHFQKSQTLEIRELLLRYLRERPWLFILDGLERVLVAYHRPDAAQLLDEDAGTSDQIAHRDPCAAIRPEDDDLLHALAAAAPSKLVLTSRLVPRALLNQAGQPIPGVLRVPLSGLMPDDAEALLRLCDVRGNSDHIRQYLKTHCDCHPLVTGVLAGLIRDYLPDRGNFDAWAADPKHGGTLNLARLTLVQKRHHIVQSALKVLPRKSRQLLSTLSLVSGAIDYQTLSALNPHRPPEPKEVKEPQNPEEDWLWQDLSDYEKECMRKEYEASLQRRKEYELALSKWQQSREVLSASQKLTKSVLDLERRGLLQYDAQARRYDLHPVVRGIAAGKLTRHQKQQYGQIIVDYFSRQTAPYEQAESIEDVRNGMHVVRTLLQMGHYQLAADAYSPALATALSVNLEAEAEKLSLLRPFFQRGWQVMPESITGYDASNLASSVAKALQAIGEREEALAVLGAVLQNAVRRRQRWESIIEYLIGLSVICWDLHRLAKQERCCLLALEIAGPTEHHYPLFSARLFHFGFLTHVGRWKDAETAWHALNSMNRDWPRELYVPGTVEYAYALFKYYRQELTEEHLVAAEQLAITGKARRLIRGLHELRGEWELTQGRWSLAANSFTEAIRMAHEVGQSEPVAATRLALAKFHLGQLPDARQEAEHLAAARNLSQIGLAELWFAIGDPVQAERYALPAYKEAWADGEPYVRRYDLNKARDILDNVGAEIPQLPRYDPAKDKKLPWEDELVAAMEELRALRKRGAPQYEQPILMMSDALIFN